MNGLDKVSNVLISRGFESSAYESAADAVSALLEEIPASASVGIGGSMTIKSLALKETLEARGNAVFWHWTDSDPAAARELAFNADYYLLSANAVSENGEIVNIDGSGNRVAATLFGKAKVRMVVGKNKLCPDLNSALTRVREIACPQNAKRLELRTPCAVTGKCADCASPQRMCNATVILERKPGAKDFKVLLVNEELGY